MKKEDLQQIRGLFKEEFAQINDSFDKKLGNLDDSFDKKLGNLDDSLNKRFTTQNEDLARMMQDQFVEQDKKFEETIKPLRDSIGGLAKNYAKQDDENIMNTAAHDRFNNNFYRIKEHLKLDSIKAVEPL